MMNRREILRGTGLVGMTAALPFSTSAEAATGSPVIAAASSLRYCLNQIVRAYVKDGGTPVRLVFGSSGNLVRQIEQGAPFALFLSADEKFSLRLTKAGLGVDGGALYAVGRMTLVARKDKNINIDSELNGVAEALKAGAITRFAIANPDHAPYGQRARDVLRHVQLWSALKDKLALGENVAQAAQFAGSGAADAGLIASALAQAPRYAKLVNQARVPAAWHKAMPQRMVRLKSASGAKYETAHGFYRFMQSPAARNILKSSGFDLPDEV